MAGIGDSWGTAEELAHPRDSHGRWRSKWKLAPEAFKAVIAALGPFSPRTFQSDSQATQYTQNLAQRKPGRFGGGKGFPRLISDFHNTNNDLLDGNPDEPSTKKYVAMMDESMIDLPEDIIVSQVMGPDAFGLTPERLPELENFTNTVIANRGYSAVNMGTPIGGGNGQVTMSIAVPKGTRAAIPGTSPSDRSVFLDRDQELTVTKVKPDGRGGYFVWAVATPKTAGENPGPVGGHAGPGHAGDREAAIKGIQEASNKRVMGEQGASQLPGGAAAGGLPEENGKVVQPPSSPEADRATRRAAILGRPASSEAAPQQAQPGAAPPAPAPTVPVAPGTPPAPETPAANVPEVPAVEPPNGATSVVTGDPATSFRDAARGADLEAPSPGSRRKEWNNAYVGITSGKKHPEDMLRELEADIANNKEQQSQNGRDYDTVLGKDIEKQEKLADLIRSHFTLGEPKQRQANQDVRNDLEAKAAKAAGPARKGAPQAKGEPAHADRLVPRKPAPPRKDTLEDRTKGLSDQASKDAADDVLNNEQRQRWADEVGVAEPKEMKGQDTAGNILLDETADLLRNGRVTRPKAVARIREHAGDSDTPEANYLRKVADAIEGDVSKPNKRVPLKKAAPRAAADVDAAEKALAGRTEKNILTGLNGQSVGNLRALAEKWGVDSRGEDKKLKLKAALAKELAAKWKATPSLQRKAEGAPEVPAKKVAKAAVKAAAPKLSPAQENEFEDLAAPEQRAYKKATKAGLSHDEAVDQAIAGPEPTKQELIDHIVAEVKKKSPAAKKLAAVAEAPEAPAVIKKAAAKAAKKAPTKRTATEKEERLTNDELAEASDRVLAGESAHDVGNEIRARRGVPPAAKAVLPEKIQGPDEVLARLQSFDNPPSREEAHQLLAPLKKPLLVQMAKELSVPGASGKNMQQLRDEIVEGTTGRRLDSVSIRGFSGERPGPIDVPPDPMDAIADQLPEDQNKEPLRKMLKEVRDEVEASSNPQGVSLEERVSVRMMAKIAKQDRGMYESIMADIPEKERNELLDAASRMGLEDLRVRRGGFDLDRIMSDAGIKPPSDGSSARPAYDLVRAHLAAGDTDKAKKRLQQEVAASDANLKSYRAGLDTPGQTQKNKEMLGRRITEEHQRRLWSESALAQLSGPGKSPELTPKQEVLHLLVGGEEGAALKKATAKQLREGFEGAGLKLPEAAKTKDQILQEVGREAVRREIARRAGQAVPELELTPPPAAKKAAPGPKEKIDARTLLPGAWGGPGALDFQQQDSKMLDDVQRALDGEAVAGIPKNSTPAAIGRYLDKWNNGVGGPGVMVAMDTIAVDGARRRMEGALPEEHAQLEQDYRAAVAHHEGLRAQTDRWRALAEKLKTTKRTPAKKALPAAGKAPEPEAPATAPVKKVLARAAKSAPTPPSRDQLNNASTREEADAMLEGLTVPQLREIAGVKTGTKANLRERIVRDTVGNRLNTDAILRSGSGTPAVKTAPKKLTPTVSENLSSFDNEDLRRITESPTFRDDQKAVVAQELARRTSTVSENGTGPSPGFNKDVSDARAKAKQAQDRFNDLEERVNRIRPGEEESSESSEVLENELEIARDERDQAEDDLAGLLKTASVKKAAPVAQQVEARRARKEVQAEVAQASNQDVESAVAQAYAELKPQNGQLVHISDVRKKLGDKYTRAEVDAAITRMNQTKNLFAEPDSDQKNLTDEQRAGEIMIGNQRKHTISMPGVARSRGAAAPTSAKKVAKTATPKAEAPAGTESREELMAMSPGQLKDIEDDLGVERKTLLRSDRVDAILAARAAKSAPPAKKATKAAKAAAPAQASPTTPGPAIRDASNTVTAGGRGQIVERERPNADEPIHLPNGGSDQGLIHIDSELGKLWADLYMDDREPNSFVNEIARMGDSMGRDELPLSKFLDRLKVMKGQAADKAVADRIQEAIDAVDSPPIKLDLPSDTPPVLRKAFQDLADIPSARASTPAGVERWRARRIGGATLDPGEPSVVEKKQALLKQIIAGKGDATAREIEANLGAHDFHESADAATTMWHIMDQALQDPTVKKWLREKILEARKRAS